MIHFNDLKRDLPGEMRRIATFLDVSVPENRWEAIQTYCSFDWMKRHASKSAPLGGAFWDGGGEVFFNKGSNGHWREVLTAQDCADYDARAAAELGHEAALWLAEGGPVR